ncbi:MAG: hypothetical protein K1X94_16075 [Sandaracinaceae bacterium]|nr:hypothetical protein [Sandaracinaceae bacterium]
MRASSLLVLASLAALGCGGSARLVAHDERGGLFALEGDEGAARQDAERQMRAHCGGRGYRITADAEYTVAMREEQEVTQAEQARRLSDDQTRLTSAVSGGTPGSALGDTVGTSGRVGESPEIYDPASTGATPRLPTPVREHRVEYECRGQRRGAP